ncbi:family mitochondrial membrane with 2 transmembrane domains at C-terminus [Cryptosporidium bovis]|uniref:family mitochondrial membrane with 2 transmembrane domains at C-terminus n=1 Tax=Cryptosporidium bovis TaxID=310047 RepID=UPI00351A2657|nr:family mitochondrial membrane with 2 transmembrane domains at C-terminus [Cryptosporidium bovis]
MSFNSGENIFEDGEYVRISSTSYSKVGQKKKKSYDDSDKNDINGHEDTTHSVYEYYVTDGKGGYANCGVNIKKGQVELTEGIGRLNGEKLRNKMADVANIGDHNYVCDDEYINYGYKYGHDYYYNYVSDRIHGKGEDCTSNNDINCEMKKFESGANLGYLKSKYYGIKKLFNSIVLRPEKKKNISVSNNNSTTSDKNGNNSKNKCSKSFEYSQYSHNNQNLRNYDNYDYGLEIYSEDTGERVENFTRMLLNMEERDRDFINGEYTTKDGSKVKLQLEEEKVDLDEEHKKDMELSCDFLKANIIGWNKGQYVKLRKEGEDRNSYYFDYLNNLQSPNIRRLNWVERYLQKQRKIPVVCIKDGMITQNYMQTAELLRKVHMHNVKQILEEKATGALTLRDLRQVVSLHGFERPSIEIRRNCILVNMPGVRCLILHDKVYYLPRKPISVICGNDGAENGKYTRYNITDYHDHCIIEKLVLITNNNVDKKDDYSENGNDLNSKGINLDLDSNTGNKEKEQYKAPLELNALEVCLVQVCTQLWDNYYKIYNTAQNFLTHIENNPTSTQKVHEINDLRKMLDSLRDRIKGVYEAIKEILDDDDLLVRIEISKFWKQPQNWDNIAILESSFFDSEILLECYEQEVEGLIRTVNRLNAQLDDAIEIMQIHLATIRNNFLKGEISLDIVGVCVGFVSAIASIFGMNIQSGLEKNIGIFWFMAYTMITMCAFAGIIVILMFRRLQL